jgi:hypothetical protein
MTRTLVAAVVVLLAGAAPALAIEDHGILILAPSGADEWNAQVKELTARANAQKPTELGLGTPTHATIQAAIDRLVARGARDVTAVPFFLATPLSPELGRGYSVPLRFAASPANDPLLTDVILSRAQEISRSPSDEVIVLQGYAADDNGTPWSVNLSSAAQRLNQMRRFASIVLIKSAPTEVERQQVRHLIDRLAGPQRRLLVVPLLTPPSGGDPNLEQCLQGYSYEVARSSVISDARLVDWLLSRTAGVN